MNKSIKLPQNSFIKKDFFLEIAIIDNLRFACWVIFGAFCHVLIFFIILSEKQFASRPDPTFYQGPLGHKNVCNFLR